MDLTYPPEADEFRATVVRRGATIGANATIVCGTEIGAYAFMGREGRGAGSRGHSANPSAASATATPTAIATRPLAPVTERRGSPSAPRRSPRRRR